MPLCVTLYRKRRRSDVFRWGWEVWPWTVARFLVSHVSSTIQVVLPIVRRVLVNMLMKSSDSARIQMTLVFTKRNKKPVNVSGVVYLWSKLSGCTFSPVTEPLQLIELVSIWIGMFGKVKAMPCIRYRTTTVQGGNILKLKKCDCLSKSSSVSRHEIPYKCVFGVLVTFVAFNNSAAGRRHGYVSDFLPDVVPNLRLPLETGKTRGWALGGGDVTLTGPLVFSGTRERS